MPVGPLAVKWHPFVLILEVHREHGLRERLRAAVWVPGQREEAAGASRLPQLPQQVEPAHLFSDQVSDLRASRRRLSGRNLDVAEGCCVHPAAPSLRSLFSGK